MQRASSGSIIPANGNNVLNSWNGFQYYNVARLTSSIDLSTTRRRWRNKQILNANQLLLKNSTHSSIPQHLWSEWRPFWIDRPCCLWSHVRLSHWQQNILIFDFPIKSNCHPKFERDVVIMIYPFIFGGVKELQLKLISRRALVPQDFSSVSALAQSKL